MAISTASSGTNRLPRLSVLFLSPTRATSVTNSSRCWCLRGYRQCQCTFHLVLLYKPTTKVARVWCSSVDRVGSGSGAQWLAGPADRVI